MFFYALTFAGSRGSCLNTRSLGQVFQHRPREPASILRKTIEGYLDSVPSLTFNTIKNFTNYACFS